MDNNENQKKDYICVYFIENHVESLPVIIKFSRNYSETCDLEKVEQNLFEPNKRYRYTIYCFKILLSKIRDKKKLEIKISLEDPNQNKFESKLIINDFTRDNYYYGFKFENYVTWGETKEPPEHIDFSLYQQFEIYIEYLREKLKKKQDEKENQDLIFETQNLLMGKDRKYNFAFYLMILLECFTTKLIKRHLLCFKPDKIDVIGKIQNKKFKRMVTILKTFEKKPEIPLKKIEEQKRDEYGIILFAIMLFFNINFDKERVQQFLNNENGKIKNYIFQGLIDEKYNNLFSNIDLTKEQIKYLINLSKKFAQIILALKYNKKLLEFLQLISENYEKVCELCLIEISNKQKPLIDVESMVSLNKNDDINEISKLYIDLINKQMDFGYIFMSFKTSLLEKYLKYFNGKNLDKLFGIKEIADFMKKKANYEVKDLNKIIHDTGVNLSKEKKLKNIEILNFISKDQYFNDSNYDKKMFRPLDVLNGLDINSLNDEFYSKWKKIDWHNIFKNQYYKYVEKVASLIINMKDFNVLFKLFDISKVQAQQDFSQYSLNILQKRFVELKKDCDLTKCPNLKDDLIKLLFYSDQKKENLDVFLINNLQKIFSVEFINDIYITFISTYKDLISNNTKKTITDFFIKNQDNSKPETLLNIIDSCPELKHNIMQSIDKFNFQKEEFFDLEEKNNLKIFKGLLDKGYIKEKEKGYNYVNNAISITNNLKKEIENGLVLFKDISIFYNENKDKKNNKENKLYSRIKLICFNNEKETEKYKKILDDYYSKISIILNDLQLIVEDLLEFYYTLEKDNIAKIKNIINDIITGNLNSIKNKNNDIEQFILSYKKNAEERALIKKSSFFNTIYKKYRIKYKIDDKKCIDDTQNQFYNLRIIFLEGIQNLDEENLKDCLIAIRGKSEEDIGNEIDLLLKIFENEVNINDDSKKKIINSMIILSKKEDVFNISLAISFFIERTGVIKTDLWEKVTKIISDLENSNDEEKINNSMEELLKANIDIKDLNIEDPKGNNYLNVLLQLKKNPDAISFLNVKNIADCRSLQEIVGEKDNAFLNANDILEFEKCVEFMKRLGDENTIKSKTDIEIINSLKKEAKDYKEKGLELFFTRYIYNYPEIQSLLEAGLDKSEASKKKIGYICDNSKFILKNVKNCFFEGHYFDDNSKKEEEIKFENLLELRDRAQLTKNLIGDNQNAKNLENFKKFIENVSEIYNLYDVLEDIYMAGYPLEIDIYVFIKNFESSYKFNDSKETDNYKDIFSKLKSILYDLKKAQLNAYYNRPLIRFIYGRQFNLIYNHLIKEKKEQSKLSPFLMFLTNNLMNNENLDFNYESTNNIYIDLINNIENYLQKMLKKNSLTLDKIYKDSLVLEKNEDGEYKGVYLCLCQKIEKELFQIYKYLTKNNPVAQNVILCNKETTIEELTAFLYRSILCEYNSCFIIGGVEVLEYDKKSKLIELLKLLYADSSDNMKSCLIILYTKKDSDIYKSLNVLRNKKILNIKSNHYENLQIEEKNVEIISSDESGVGKSTQIKLSIEKANKVYIHFPFGGVFTREDVIERLKKLEIEKKDPKNTALHLDLYDTDQIDLMMEFLFSILITKLYGRNEDIFYLPKDVIIKIEIPNGFIDYISKFQILTLFETNNLSIKKLAPLIVPKEINSNIQIVANYLKAFNEKRIDDKDLFFENCTPSDFHEYITCEEAQCLEQKECQDLIFDEIKKKINEPNYYQIRSFIDILATQFRRLNRNIHINANILTEFQFNRSIRTFIVESFIKITKHFTEGAFTTIVKSQKSTQNILFGKYNENEDINKAIEELANAKHNIVSFEKIDPSLLFFHEGEGYTFSIITNKERGDPEYDELYNLKNYQFRDEALRRPLPDYKTYDAVQFLQELKEILNLNNPVTEEEKIRDNNPRKTLKEIAGNYVFTKDNFVKMALILLRIRANIPVIMMGETGCGKTSLIRKLSEMILANENDERYRMRILNIHAGISEKDIITFLETNVIQDAKELQKEEIQKSLSFEVYEKKKLWVFLDEINTCKSMGLISELMCKHSYQGIPLPDNIVFIAACNPYRIGKESIKSGLNVNQAKKEMKNLSPKDIERLEQSARNNLVYTVNPLPHSLLNFVFDFGSLEKEDEENYIKSMIKEPIKKIFDNNKEENLTEQDFINIHNLAKELIVTAQNFVREKNGVSSVSLREIRRFIIFYEFFFDYLMKKKEIDFDILENKQIKREDIIFYQTLGHYYLQIYSIILAVFVCYYLRLTDIKTRNQLQKLMNSILKRYDNTIKDFIDIPLKEEEFIVSNIELERGIAKNTALLDNIFSLFVAINNKVPIFIVGKPGCSKSLSVQLINKSMKGSSSNNPIFKKLPKIILYSYQGSMGSTSQGVEKVFKKAHKAIENLEKLEDRKNNISMIYFDEMGLAEHSPNNPLKVIHAELEYDLNKGDKKIAFVGISNWVLDASKMNRGMFLSIPDPEEEDTKKTALTIGISYDEQLAKQYKTFYENLGTTYFKYKQYLKAEHNSDGKDEFHGNRDFYHLIKNAANRMIDLKIRNIDQHLLENMAIASIERNFGGLRFNDVKKTTSLEKVKKILKDIYPNCQVRGEYEVIERISENINDLKSRYLLIISKSSVSTFLISSILKNLGKDYSFYIGSQFINDLQSEEYSLKILNKIQLHMEQGKVLILKNLESVYPALYDLFNQNFTEVSKKNYARIAIGSSNNAFSFVNDKFRCIVNVDEEMVNEEEPPFLNRFEKHIVSFEYLLDNKSREESNRIKELLDELCFFDKNEFKGINYDIRKTFVNSDLEEIQGIIYQEIKRNNININTMFDYVINKVSLILPLDIIFCQEYNGFKSKYPQISEQIKKEYSKGEHRNLSRFLETMENMKNIVYTFSNNLDAIENINAINNKIFGKIYNNENIKNLKISSFDSENAFEKEIDEFLNDDKFKICLIHFNSNEGNFLNYIKFFIENKEKEIKSQNKGEKLKKAFVFIVHLVRIFNEDIKDFEKKSEKEKQIINKKYLNETISLSSEYYQIFIDNLNGDGNLSIDEILYTKDEKDKEDIKGEELLSKYLDFDFVLRRNIYISLSYMKYNISIPLGNLNINTYVNKLIHYFENHKELRDNINKYIRKHFINEENFVIKVLKTEEIITHNDIDMVSIIKKYLSNYYIKKLNYFYYKAEQDQFFSTLLSIDELNKINSEKNNKKNEIINEEDKKDEKDGKKEEINIEDNEVIKGLIKKTADTYLKKLDLTSKEEELKVKEKQGENELDIVLGLKLPGIKTIISSTVKKFKKEIFKSYRNQEEKLRTNIEPDKIDEMKRKYYDKIKGFNESIFIELDNNNLLSEIELKEEYFKSDFCDLFLEDYCTLFVVKLINGNNNKKEINKTYKDFNEIKKMLRLIIDIKNDVIKDNKKENDLKMTVSSINWIECYSMEIEHILNIFSKLNSIIGNLYEQISDIIKNGKIKYVIPNQQQVTDYSSIVNKDLFFIIEAILKVFTSKENIYNEIINDGVKFKKLLDICNEIFQIFSLINDNLALYSKEIYSLQEIITLMECFISNGILTKDNIKKLINFFKDEIEYINNGEEEKLVQNFNNLYNILYNLIGKEKSINKIMSIIFKNEFIKVPNVSFRVKILEIILSNDNFIINNFQLFRMLILFDETPDEMSTKINSIINNNHAFYKTLNKCTKEFFEQTIINLFEFEILKYFEGIAKLKKLESFEKGNKAQYRTHFPEYYKSISNENNKEPVTKIIFDLSLNIFRECVLEIDNYLSNETDKNNQNYNLCKLYAIAYIKIYLSKFSLFVFEKNQYIGDISQITSIIIGNAKDNKFRKVLKIYVLKIFFNLMNKDWNAFGNYNFSHYGISFIDILSDNNEVIKEIIEEKIMPTDEKYKDYPLLKYFVYTKYKNREDFMKSLEPKENKINEFPLLFKYLSEDKKDSNLKKLQYLYNFNEFSNYMIDNYSLKIPREEAKEKPLNLESIFRENGFEKKFNNFKKSWKVIKKNAIKYKFHPVMVEKNLDENEKLIFFLTDNNEPNYGMYFAAAYENFISFQNDFLNYIMEKGKNKKYLNIYNEYMKKEIPIYEANTNQIVLINNCFLDSTFNDFDDLINVFSYRNIFNKDSTINYLNYNEFKYDISSIEEELAKLLLTGKCLFEKDNLRLIVYLGELFNKGKSDILDKFYQKYRQKELDDKEKQLILEYMNDPEKNNNYKDFYSSLQLLIFYLSNNNFKESITIKEIIIGAPEYVKIEKICSEFFEKEQGKEFTVDKIMNIFFFFEHLCFEEFCKNIQDVYKKNINDELLVKITNKLLNNKKLNDIFTIKELGAAVRRFISRYLIGKKQNVDINENSPLIPVLKRPELWGEKISKIGNLDELISNLLEEFNLTVGQIFNFYELIKEEDEKEIIYEELKADQENIIKPSSIRRRI